MLEYPQREQVYLETDEYMQPGTTYALRLKFSYMLGRHLEGFYYSEYVDKSGVRKRIASTHFEPTYARRAFPCFDEPGKKSHRKKLMIGVVVNTSASLWATREGSSQFATRCKC